MSCGIIYSHSTPFDVFGILTDHQWVISMWISEKAKILGVNYVQGISSSKIREKMFFTKNLNNN